jgi:GNAT superfamily N-acetyltransferase
VVFRKLGRQHDRRAFDCGVESVNRYLQQTARQQAEKDLALTFVLLETEDSQDVIGFHTLLMSTVSGAILPAKDLPRQQSAPVILLAQFGVDRRHQGRGHGTRLLYHALYQAMRAAEHVGCMAVVLDAVDEQARDFYLARGYRELTDDPNHLWLPMSAIREMFAKDQE